MCTKKNYRGIDFEIKRKKCQKNIYFRAKDHRIIVSCPSHISDKLLFQIIDKKFPSLIRAVEKSRMKKFFKDFSFCSGERVFLFGKAYELSISQTNDIFLHGEESIFIGNDKDPKKAMKEFYKTQLKSYIESIIDKYKLDLGLKEVDFRIRDMYASWGTCYPERGFINLSLSLSLYPKPCIDMVLVHELCHFKKRGHQKDFYKLLEKVLPDWKETNLLLKAGLTSIN